MRYLLLSDVHANLEALDAVLTDAAAHRPGRTVCLGDVVGYGPDPNGCAARLVEAGAACLAGNHDLAAIGRSPAGERFNPFAQAALVWTAGHLAAATAAFLAGLPLALQEPSFLAVHGSPRDPASEYVLTAAVALRNFRERAFALCFVGHTHVPAAFVLDGARARQVALTPGVALPVPPEARAIVNVGSVGQPRDGDPRAAYAIFDDDARSATLHRIAYPLERTQARMRAAGLPQLLIDRLAAGI